MNVIDKLEVALREDGYVDDNVVMQYIAELRQEIKALEYVVSLYHRM